MKLRLLPASLLLACTVTQAADANPVPKALEEQVVRLVTLLKDGFATGYPEATKVQTLNTSRENQVTLAVFIVEGFYKGNNYRQYLAAFKPDATEAGAAHYTLLGVIHIGGGGWRAIQALDATRVSGPTDRQVLIDIPVMENRVGDAVNFPSKPGVVHLTLSGDAPVRLVEKD